MALAAAVTGCRKDIRPNVGMGMILPPGAVRSVVPEDQLFLMATEISTPLPSYPSDLVKASPADIMVCAELVLGTDGAVTSVRPLYAIPECPLLQSELDPRFTEAVRDAVLKWQFFAAALCTFPPGVPKDDDCKSQGVTIRHVPIKLAFVFTFSTKHGRATVSKKAT